MTYIILINNGIRVISYLVQMGNDDIYALWIDNLQILLVYVD